MAPRDPAWDELYAAALDEFARVRARLVAEAKKAGRAEEAGALQKARKPTVTAWVVNQLARAEPEAMEALFAAGDGLRGAQSAVLAGQGTSALREAQRAEGEALARLRDLAQSMLEARGHEATPDQLRRITQTLRAALVGDEDVRAPVREGRLAEDLVPEAFFGMAAALPERPPSPPPPKVPAKPPPAKAPPAKEPAKAPRPSAAEERRAAAQQRREAEAAEKRAREEEKREAERLAQARVRARERAQEEVAKLEERLVALERTALAAEAGAAQAVERAKAARARADEARRALEQARAREKELSKKA